MNLTYALALSIAIYFGFLAKAKASPVVGGTIQIDSVFINDDKTELIPGNGTELRRARLFISGHHNPNWDYKLRVGFEENDLSVKDAYMNNTQHGLKIGLFKPAFSLDEITSSKFITFMEQALPNAFKPGRRIGIAYSRYQNHININFGVFGQGSADGDNGDEGFGISHRLTTSLFNLNTTLLHLGYNLTIEQAEDNVNNSISFDARPESHLTDNIVDTGNITDIKSITRSGIEAAFVMQSFSVQSEIVAVNLARKNALDDLSFVGSYIYASYFFTGEQRIYKARQGKFSRIIPIDEDGAWEIALRYSTIDLNDKTVTGGNASNTTIGINWYSSKKTRFTMNYIHINTDDSNIYGNPDILQFRAQIDF